MTEFEAPTIAMLRGLNTRVNGTVPIWEWAIWWLESVKDPPSLSHWDVFGFGEPEWSKAKIQGVILEINPPIKGRNKQTQGQFVKNDDGDVYIAHSGKMKLQSGSDESFDDVYQGSAPLSPASGYSTKDVGRARLTPGPTPLVF